MKQLSKKQTSHFGIQTKESHLFRAIQENNMDLSLTLLSSGVNAFQSVSNKLLIEYAAINKNQVLVFALYKASHYYTERHLAIVMKVAILNRDNSMVLFLIKRLRCSVNVAIYGLIPIQIALLTKNKALVLSLIEYGANCSVLYPDGMTLLHVCVKYRFLSLVNPLIEGGIYLDQKNKEGLTALDIASTNNDHQMANLIREVDIKSQLEDQHGYYDKPQLVNMIRLHIEEAEESLADLIRKKTGFGSRETLKKLFLNVLKIEKKVKNRFGHFRVKQLVSIYQKCQIFVASILIEASSVGDVNLVTYLIEEGVSIDTKGPNGWYPIHAAAFSNQRTMFSFLIGKGADPEMSDEDGWTANQLVRLISYQDK